MTDDDARRAPRCPACPGSPSASATPADWDAMAAVQNAARRADGVDEVHTGTSLAAEHPDGEIFQLDRDMLLAEVDGALVAFRRRLPRRTATARSSPRPGASSTPTTGGAASGRRSCGRTARASSRSVPPTRGPGPASSACYALDEEVSDRALLEAEGFVPDPVRVRDAAVPHRRACRTTRSPTGSSCGRSADDRVPGDLRRRQRGVRGPLGPSRRRRRADYQARFHGPEATPSLWAVAWDGDQVAGVVMNSIFHDENEALGIKRAWLEHVSVRRPWRGRGLAKALCAASFRDPPASRAWTRPGWASTRRTRPARWPCTRASGSRSCAAGRRSGGRSTGRRRRGGRSGSGAGARRLERQPALVADELHPRPLAADRRAAPCPGSTRSRSSSVARRARPATIASASPPGKSTRPQPPGNSVSPLNSRPSSADSRQTEPSVWPGVWRTWRRIVAEPDLAALRELDRRHARRDLERGVERLGLEQPVRVVRVDRDLRAGVRRDLGVGAHVVPVAMRVDDQLEGPARAPRARRRSSPGTGSWCRSRSPRGSARRRGRRRWSTAGRRRACRRSMVTPPLSGRPIEAANRASEAVAVSKDVGVQLVLECQAGDQSVEERVQLLAGERRHDPLLGQRGLDALPVAALARSRPAVTSRSRIDRVASRRKPELHLEDATTSGRPRPAAGRWRGGCRRSPRPCPSRTRRPWSSVSASTNRSRRAMNRSALVAKFE